MSTVLVTGVTGFVGSHIAAELARCGHRIIGTTSAGSGLGSGVQGVERMVVWRLGETIDPALDRDVDAVIHCAWDIRPGTAEANTSGTLRLAEAMRTAGATYQLFISTYSAHPLAVTDYGRTKLAVQEQLRDRGCAAARLGFVIGPGGIYQRMADTVAQHRVVPLIDGGRIEIPIIGVRDLVEAIAAIVERQIVGTFNLFNPDRVELRDVLFAVRAHAPRRPVFVPIAGGLLVAPLWVARRVGIKLPLDVDNVRALLANRDFREQSDLSRFVANPMTLADMLVGL